MSECLSQTSTSAFSSSTLFKLSISEESYESTRVKAPMLHNSPSVAQTLQQMLDPLTQFFMCRGKLGVTAEEAHHVRSPPFETKPPKRSFVRKCKDKLQNSML